MFNLFVDIFFPDSSLLSLSSLLHLFSRIANMYLPLLLSHLHSYFMLLLPISRSLHSSHIVFLRDTLLVDRVEEAGWSLVDEHPHSDMPPRVDSDFLMVILVLLLVQSEEVRSQLLLVSDAAPREGMIVQHVGYQPPLVAKHARIPKQERLLYCA